jgi:hypothetical protein
MLGMLLSNACSTTATDTTTTPTSPTATTPPATSPTATEATTAPATTPSPPPTTTEEPIDEFALWWEDFKQPFTLDSSTYPEFYRGAWGARLDELRSYLLNADKLREGGVDTIMMEAEIVLDPKTRKPKSIGENITIFYLQALKREGFRIILIPNPMHPNLDQGLGYDWENSGDPDAYYHPSYELIKEFDGEVIKWAAIAEEYGAEAFLPTLEPYKLAGHYEVTSQWLQEILPQIREVYHGQVWATDIMFDIGEGLSIPRPLNYNGYDFLISGPPAGRQDAANCEEMIEVFIQKGLEYTDNYSLNGFGLYEYGGYTGGIWYEDPQMEIFNQILLQDEAADIAEALVRQASGTLKASFPRISLGWVDYDTPSYEIITAWYKSMGENISPIESGEWTYEQLMQIEQKLGGEEYESIFRL